ncbi:MAG: alpha/beta hydrolase [Nitrococcus mobilis]|nr:alpha/beta hydrolase [Nitrococcus mobilis]
MIEAATGSWLIDGPESELSVVLAHGAGAPMDSEFMNVMAAGIAHHGLRVVRFEFPYMAARRRDGKKRPPDREAALLECWRGVLRELGAAERRVIGGKSLGGRMASLIADELGVAGLICLGYPFHPPGRSERLRIDHLQSLQTPALILQGERDSLGWRDEVSGYPLAPAIRLDWLPDGDHSFKPRQASGHTWADNLAQAVQRATAFIDRLPR